jgi:hypothetical protein
MDELEGTMDYLLASPGSLKRRTKSFTHNNPPPQKIDPTKTIEGRGFTPQEAFDLLGPRHMHIPLIVYYLHNLTYLHEEYINQFCTCHTRVHMLNGQPAI